MSEYDYLSTIEFASQISEAVKKRQQSRADIDEKSLFSLSDTELTLGIAHLLESGLISMDNFKRQQSLPSAARSIRNNEEFLAVSFEDEISALQERLGDNLVVDGFFGGRTRTAALHTFVCGTTSDQAFTESASLSAALAGTDELRIFFDLGPNSLRVNHRGVNISDVRGLFFDALRSWQVIDGVRIVANMVGRAQDANVMVNAKSLASNVLGQATIGGRPITRQLELTYNRNIQFRTEETNGSSSTPIFEAVTSHELGHILGIDPTTINNPSLNGHLPCGSCLMQPVYNDSIRTPQGADRDKIRLLWPAN